MGYRVVAQERNAFGISLANAGLIIAGVSILTLAGALGIEHIGGIPPCPLCLDQRIAYYAAIPLGITAYAFASGRPVIAKAILAILAIGFVINAGLGIYHSGVEWAWWSGPEACSGAASPLATSPTDLLQSLNQTQVVRCDEAALRIFGLSLAGYSALFSLLLSGIALAPLLTKD
ncbi:MAG: disulfide bond formation protein B [Hyphomicrobiales bacterium]|nr:disulfide bond formation protein B [Hyphomicrobiales bacterium]